ncbi:porin [Bradyrhizobium sp. 174]|uniref:porin n=1 Tax=Bradyrhizobium sp. 174 TaxID=2782645 RepID=UPI001FFAB39C|nr:porin [Bradyrhizobium sp. 174]MCK1571215.1 porin [Bradyrhizobium sp. 174]
MRLMKGFILGSAAMLVTAGAQAADLPVKAKAVEYVKICSLYGAGFYYIPGTDTCIKLGGYARFWTTLRSNSAAYPADSYLGGAQNRLSNYYTMRSREALSIDTRTATEYGMVRTFFQGAFSWTSGGYAGVGTTATNGATAYDARNPAGSGSGQVSNGSLWLQDAFIQFAGFTLGKAQSQFSAPWADYPGNWYELAGSSGWERVNQLTYTADFGQGVTASFSAQDQVANFTTNVWNVSGATVAGLATGVYGASNIGGSRAPDLVATVRVDQAWGLFQASFAAHDNHAGYYGAAETSGYAADKWGWAGQVSLSIKNLPTGLGDSINMSGVYTNGASRYSFNSFMSTAFAMYGGTNLPGAYQSVGFAGLSDSVFVAGAAQELTTTYGFNGAFNHNWDPRWATSIYGGIAAVRYNNTAKGYICNAVVTNLALSTGMAGCNPDFNYGSVGTYTSWTPVKGLTFLADINFTMLDQKYAGGSIVALPLQSTVAKPGAAYELKSQNSLTMLLHAQRNW